MTYGDIFSIFLVKLTWKGPASNLNLSVDYDEFKFVISIYYQTRFPKKKTTKWSHYVSSKENKKLGWNSFEKCIYFLDLELRIFQSLSFLIFNQFSGINGIFWYKCNFAVFSFYPNSQLYKLLKFVKFVIFLKNLKVFTQKPKYQNFMMAKRNEIQEINFFNLTHSPKKKTRKNSWRKLSCYVWMQKLKLLKLLQTDQKRQIVCCHNFKPFKL
jgi:hypothetical protein